MVDFEQLATRYFPHLKGINTWIQLAEYWTQKNDVLLSYNHSFELIYSYLLFSLTDTGFTLVIEEEKNILSLRSIFDNIEGFVFLDTKAPQEQQKQAISAIQNNTAKVVIVSVQRFFQKGNKFLEYLKSYQVQQIAVHNAQKLSFWGEMNEIYSGLEQLKSYLRHVPIIAVAPVYTKSLSKDLISSLHLYQPILLYINDLDDTFVYRVSTLQTQETIENKIQSIAQKHELEKGILISQTKYTVLPNNLSMLVSAADVSFAIYADMPNNLEQIYDLQSEYGIDIVYVIYDEKQVERRKKELESAFERKLHKDIAIKRFGEVVEWCKTELCKKQALEKHWQMPVKEPCGKCNFCLSEEKESINISVNVHHFTHDIEKIKSILITLRLRIAKNNNVLVHQVFSDITLEELATYLPQNESDLTQITGLGTKKIQLYGNSILDAILDFCTTSQVSDNMHSLRELRKKRTISQNANNKNVSVVKKAKINAAVQELGHWDSQMIYEFLKTEEITLSEIESVIMHLQK